MMPVLGMILVAGLRGQTPVDLPVFTVYSPRIANQSPAATFAMPVSALSFEPRVDVQSRNLAEGQADISIRGGTFENTAYRIGGVTVMDPQTGHYLAELPVIPAMLGPPVVLTGAQNALAVSNASVGAISHGWRPIERQGVLGLGVGRYDLRRAEFYQAATAAATEGQPRLGADIGYAWSQSDGSIAFGDHHFERVGARVQRISGRAQTDLYAGYQAKFFGWPNLYTPFGFNETENLQTVFMALNHRITWNDGQYFEGGWYHRRNKDDYEFNRAVPGASNPFQHTTWINGIAAEGRRVFGNFALRVRGEAAKDKIESTALTFGRYHTRTITKLTAVTERNWTLDGGGEMALSAGLARDDTNRDGGALAPVVELTRRFDAGNRIQSLSLGYAQTTQVPTYTALNSDAAAGLFRGNANLGRTTSHNLELGLRGDLAHWQTTAALFYRQDDRLVDWTFRRGVTARTANPVDIATGGVEVVTRHAGNFGHITLGYTYLTKSADYGSAAIDASFYALNYARHRLTAALALRLGKEWEVRWDNEARVQADNALRTTGGDETVLSSLALAWRPLAWRGVECSLQIDNLWNSNFQEVPAVPAANRQIVLGVRYLW
jgi:hypothetical protein